VVVPQWWLGRPRGREVTGSTGPLTDRRADHACCDRAAPAETPRAQPIAWLFAGPRRRLTPSPSGPLRTVRPVVDRANVPGISQAHQASTSRCLKGPTAGKLGSDPASLRGPSPILSGAASRTHPCTSPRLPISRAFSGPNPATGVSAQCRQRQSPPCESLAALSQPTISLSTNPLPRHTQSASAEASFLANRPGATAPCRVISSPRSARPKWAAG